MADSSKAEIQVVIETEQETSQPSPKDSNANGDDDSNTKEHACELCKRVFSNKRDFLLHQYNHKEKASFYCAFCFKTFTSEFAFKRHNKLHEKKKLKAIVCKICKKEFDYVRDLEEHHRLNHLNEKMFSCKFCKATFSWRENLNKHMRMHDNPTKPDHKCDRCGRDFMDNISFRLHECDAAKKETKPDKPFVCKICSKAFKFDFSFEAHMNSHEGPVALNAYKQMQYRALEEKKQQVQLAAKQQLLSNTPNPPSVNPIKVREVDKTDNPSASVNSNLQEIVLEIVNVNELPKVNPMEGTTILAEGGEGDVTTMLPVTEISTVSPFEISPAVDDVKGESLSQPENDNDDHDDLVDDVMKDAANEVDQSNGTISEDKNTETETKKKKEPKRLKRPLLYDYVMTEEKPFGCPQCGKEFRWEISLNIHLQEHIGGNPNVQQRKPRAIRKPTPCTMHQSSKIVYRRDSSDEEDYFQDGPSFTSLHAQSHIPRKRGRPRKEVEPNQPPVLKRKRGRPPKDPYKRSHDNETLIIKVTKSDDLKQVDAVIVDMKGVEDEDYVCEVNIPKHRLIRFYLLRQLKLSRHRGFFPCRFCNKPFSCKASLNMHILRHTGKGSYRCGHCNQKFPDHRTLVLHRLIEEEEAMDSPHQCATCCRACSSSSRLLKHIQRHLAVVWPSSKPRAKVTNIGNIDS